MAENNKINVAGRARTARTARRSVASEMTLIFCAGGALLAVVLFWFGMPNFLRIADMVPISPVALWVASSFCLAFAWSVVHGRRLSPKIRAAQDEVASWQYAQQDKRQQEANAKIAAMNAGTN